MNKKINSGLAIVLPNKKVNLFVIFVIILGIISGSIFLMALNETDKTAVTNQITSFFTNINDNNINNLQAFKNTFIENLIYTITIWILGMSIVGVIFNIFFAYLKGFIIGFSLSSFFFVFKYKGILAGLIYLFPSYIINIIGILIIAVYSILFTINLWKIIFLKDKTTNISRFLKKYFLVLIISLLLIAISSLLESYLIPSILKLFIKVFI